MSDIINFKLVKKVDAVTFMLDFLNQIDVVASMEGLFIGVSENVQQQQQYAQWLYDNIKEELDYIAGIIVSNEPSTWNVLRDAVKKQIKDKDTFIRFRIAIRIVDTYGNFRETEQHEMIIIPKDDQYLLVGYNINQVSLPTLLTSQYIEQMEEYEETPQPIKLS